MELDDTVYIELATIEKPIDQKSYIGMSFGTQMPSGEGRGPKMETRDAPAGDQRGVSGSSQPGLSGGRGRDSESGDRVATLTSETAGLLQKAITAVASQLKPDLDALGASKATVKLGAKLTVKSGKLAALIAEAGGEGTVEITLEFTAK